MTFAATLYLPQVANQYVHIFISMHNKKYCSKFAVDRHQLCMKKTEHININIKNMLVCGKTNKTPLVVYLSLIISSFSVSDSISFLSCKVSRLLPANAVYNKV